MDYMGGLPVKYRGFDLEGKRCRAMSRAGSYEVDLVPSLVLYDSSGDVGFSVPADDGLLAKHTPTFKVMPVEDPYDDDLVTRGNVQVARIVDENPITMGILHGEEGHRRTDGDVV